MSMNELIAEAYTQADRAADAAPVSARQAILTGKVEDQRLSLIVRLAHALEAVTAQRDELAAVVEQVRATLEHYQGQKVDVAPIDILPAPSVALDRVKAGAWDEWVARAETREAKDAFDENPYRREKA